MNHPAFLWAATLPTNVVSGVSTLGPLGFWGRAPGTIGSLVGIFIYTAFLFPLGFFGEVALLALFVYLAVGFCGEAEKRMFVEDPPHIILDEVVAVPFCFLGLKTSMLASDHMWLYIVAGLFLFRLFDILKPFGISKLQRLDGGLGVVADDIAAALATCLTLHLVVWFVL